MSSPIDFYHVSLKVFLRNAKGEILALKCPDHYLERGYFDVPGGRINEDEFDESLENIIKREIAEEVGDINYELHPHPISLGRHLLTKEYTKDRDQDLHIFYIFFMADYLGGDIQLSEEHSDHRWVDVKQEPIDDIFIDGIANGLKMYLERQ